jgi:hypothetical protein
MGVARPAKVIIQEEQFSQSEFNPETIIVAQVPVNSKVMAVYQGQAVSRSSTTAKIMGERLSFCADYADPQGLFFGGENRQKLEHLLRDNLPTEDDVIRKLQEALSFTVQGETVQISVPQLKRLQLGLRKGQTLGNRLNELVQRAVVGATGTR